MKTKVIFIFFLTFSLSLNAFSQGNKEELINGYDNIVTSHKDKSQKGYISPSKNKNKPEFKIPGTIPPSPGDIEIKDIYKDTLFYESFSSKTLDNPWILKSGTNNMSAYTDSVRGKVFKISSNNPNGNSFLEYYLTNLIKGKKIKLKAFIKTESIIKGVQPYYVGKLCLKFKVGTVDYYEAVQNLMGSLDWKEHYAEADGDHPNVFVGNELTVFNVPANATNVTLYFGLQNCTGTIYFSNIQVVEVL